METAEARRKEERVRSKSCKVITQIREFDWTEASVKKAKKKKKNADWGTITGQDLTEKCRDTRCFLEGCCSHKFSYFNLYYRRCCQRSFGIGATLGRRILPSLHSLWTPPPTSPIPVPPLQSAAKHPNVER